MGMGTDMTPIQVAMKRFGLDPAKIDAEAVNNLYLLWCSEGEHEEHAQATDAAFRREFGPGPTETVLLIHYREHARSSLLEYFERLSELNAAHAPTTLASCLEAVNLADADLQRTIVAHLPKVAKAYAAFVKDGEYREEWESLESDAWEWFDALDAILDPLATANEVSKKKAKSTGEAPAKKAKKKPETVAEETEDAEVDAETDHALEAEIAGVDWSAMARSLVAPSKKSVPAGLEPLLKAFGAFFDQNGEYPTIDELSEITKIKKNVIADVYEELEETFIEQRLD